MSRRAWILSVAGIVLVLGGCSDKVDYGATGTISGRLTLGGNPLRAGTYAVFMHPEKGYLAFGKTDTAGNFTVNSWNEGQMPIGTYRVMVQPPTPENDPETADPEDVLNNPEKYSGGPVEPDFPEKYRETTTSGLSYEVKEGPNTFQIDLTK